MLYECPISLHSTLFTKRLEDEPNTLGTGYAGIFYDNARKNGLALPIVTPEGRDALLQLAASEGGHTITIDIEHRSITAGDSAIPFQMDDAT